MHFKLLVAVAVVVLDGRFLDGSVRSFDLAVGPRMSDPGHPVLDVVLAAAQVGSNTNPR
jgi:hypothetical protein